MSLYMRIKNLPITVYRSNANINKILPIGAIAKIERNNVIIGTTNSVVLREEIRECFVEVPDAD